ncbi:hypothetical protein CHI02_23610, partial [Niallia circulans]
MIWENYKEEFVKVALESGHNDEYIEKHLNYAKSLFIKGLPIIFNQDHLSLLVGYKLEYLIKVSNAQSKFYRVFNIPKKNGGKRKIAEPLPNLKAIQKWILEEILNKCKTSDFAKAYKKGISLKENAKYHRRQKKVLTIDIEN